MWICDLIIDIYEKWSTFRLIFRELCISNLLIIIIIVRISILLYNLLFGTIDNSILGEGDGGMYLYGENNSGGSSGSSGNGGPSNGGQPGGGPPGGGPSKDPSQFSTMSDHQAKKCDRDNAWEELNDMAQRDLYFEDNYSTMTAEQKKAYLEQRMRHILITYARELNTESGRMTVASKYPEYHPLSEKIRRRDL